MTKPQAIQFGTQPAKLAAVVFGTQPATTETTYSTPGDHDPGILAAAGESDAD